GLVAACCVMLAATYGTAARADATTSQKAAAQALFDQATNLVEQGHFAEACPKLAESQRLDPGLGTMLWLADCLENNGQTASAWAAFTEAAAAAARAQDKREHVARERAAALAPRLSRLAILVPPGAASQGVVVERDGVAIGPAEWGVPVPVDPGVHAIAASAPGHKSWSTTVQLPARPDTLQVTVPQLDAAIATPAAPAHDAIVTPPSDAAPASPSPPETPTALAARRATWRTVALTLAGAGVVGLGIGTYFAFHAKSTYDGATSSGHCLPDNQCDGTGKQQRSDAFSQASVATVALGLGAAAVVGGAVLYFTAPAGTQAAAGVAPSARGGTAWVSVDW
ncbi:MAG: hypothetical protein ACRELB_23615, partial [Polyangiaceae bacterium]